MACISFPYCHIYTHMTSGSMLNNQERAALAALLPDAGKHQAIIMGTSRNGTKIQTHAGNSTNLPDGRTIHDDMHTMH
jgi:hypothetical protein